MNLSKDRKKLIMQSLEAINDLNKDNEGNPINEYIEALLVDIEIALDPLASKEFIKLILGEHDDFYEHSVTNEIVKHIENILEGDDE